MKENWSGDTRIDIVLLDLHLPDGAGFELYERLLNQAPWVPVILLTNLNDEELALKTVRNGAQDYLLKTEVDCRLLGRAIRYAIERKQIKEALKESEERYILAIQGSNGICKQTKFTIRPVGPKFYYLQSKKSAIQSMNGKNGFIPMTAKLLEQP